MLLPWSKPIVIAIARDGIAIKQPNKKPELLSLSADNRIDYDGLLDTFTPFASSLKNQYVRVIISNHFMRYTVLPWQEGVNARADWLALAEHAFRKEYGAVTNEWDFRVNLDKSGAPVVASAMDNAILLTLRQLSTNLNFKLFAIEPLLMTISSHHKANESLLIVEPERLLLCEIEDGAVTGFSTNAPHASQEAERANQLLARYRLQHPSSKLVFSYISSALNDDWASNSYQNIMKLNQHKAAHACWMAGL